MTRPHARSRDQRTLDSLRNEFYTTIPTLKKQMYEEVVKQGYFDENPNSVRNRYTLFAVLFLVVAVLPLLLYARLK